MGAERNKATDCPHNVGLVCDPCERDCKTCGWSPEVDARRRKTLREGLHGKTVNAPPPSEPRPKQKREYKEHTVVCTVCGAEFVTAAPGRVKYCKVCAVNVRREQNKLNQQKRKEAASIDKGKAQTIRQD